MKHVLRTALVLLILGGAARPASADWLFTPYLGVVFGGAANTFDINDLDDEFEQRLNFGGSLAWMGNGIVGFEVDYGVAPNFFQFKGPEDDIELLDFDSSMQTLMANLTLGAPIGGTTGPGIRPYASGGLGLMRSNLSSPTDLFDDLSTNELGVNVGGGVHVFFSDNVGLRGDVRYFRGLQQQDDDDPVEDDDFIDEDFGLEDFDFWRATLGITFRFGQ
ncbi:MAG: outer membrane beta-barrel protein [Vicinamibacterales bacterium]